MDGKAQRYVVSAGLVLLLLLTRASTPPKAQGFPNWEGADPTGWSRVESPNVAGGNTTLTDVDGTKADDLWAIGRVYPGCTGQSVIEHWAGTQWQLVASPSPGAQVTRPVRLSARTANDVWAVGDIIGGGAIQTLALHWDGTAWTVIPTPNSGTYSGLYDIAALSDHDVWAVGTSGNIHVVGCSSYSKGHQDFFAIHWDGTQWNTVPMPPANDPTLVSTPFTTLTKLAVVAANDIWAVGNTNNVGHSANDRGFLRHWDGSSWQAIPDAVATSTHRLFTAVAVNANDVWVGGTLNQSGDTLIEHWNGATWAVVPSPNVGAVGGMSAVNSNDVWATAGAGLLHWNGTKWEAFNPLLQNGSLEGIRALAPDNIWSVGYTIDDGVYHTLIAHYTGPNSTPTPSPAPTGIPTPVPTVAIPGDTSQHFVETNKTVPGIFGEYWQQHGGLAQQGYPISEVRGEISELNQQPYTVQYFERAVFEYHPENGPPYNILLSQLGTFQYRRKYPQGAPDQHLNQTNGIYFSQTGHWVGGKFWAYWQAHGGLAQQGYPLSDEFTEISDLNGQPYTVQYFERAVFESHPENAPPYDILLSQLGTVQYKQKYPQP